MNRMKKIFIYLITAVLSGLFIPSCSDGNVDVDHSIFDTVSPERTEFDKWILENFIHPYNVDLKYRMEDIESSRGYELVPAEIEKAKKLAKLTKFLWFEVYDEGAGPDFTRAYVPKVIHMIGSAAWNSNNTIVLGTAEGGMKVTLYNVNSLVVDIDFLNYYYFHTMHHEFAHILHQTKNYDTNYQLITEGDYVGGNWYQYDDAYAYGHGFVSRYSMSAPDEDFVEMYSRFLTYTPEEWDYILSAAGTTGRPVIDAKFEIMKNYFRDEWSIDVYEMRNIVQRRSSEIDLLDLDNLY